MLATEGSKNELGGTQRREGKTVLSHSHHLGEAPSSTLHTTFDSNVAKVIHYRGITKKVIKLSISFKKKNKGNIKFKSEFTKCYSLSAFGKVSLTDL